MVWQPKQQQATLKVEVGGEIREKLGAAVDLRRVDTIPIFKLQYFPIKQLSAFSSQNNSRTGIIIDKSMIGRAHDLHKVAG